ncbi:TetR family transcriptional regulator [Cellulomonas chitinilytica]|uniref:TetR family transcriptional regulator n=1 Tax=Cellulomonas chitinilytica TaxID=398759 RepID=A0A919U3J5_9CELL|nr:TetR family transcriptional regulator [Cellulomonas chitinilytica]GIG22209.1 TetR family transcriptional regulator [Cellulomonas chitinilytica]
MTARRARGEARSAQVVRAAADLLLLGGPGAVSHRAVAARAGVPLAATTYYFDRLDDLVRAAALLLADESAAHAERVAELAQPGDDVVATVVDAVLPNGGDVSVRAVYEHLVSAGRTPTVAGAYAAGRTRLDAAVAALLRIAGSPVPPALAIAVVDGAVVAALSEGHDVRDHARALLAPVLTPSPPTPA